MILLKKGWIVNNKVVKENIAKLSDASFKSLKKSYAPTT